MTLPSTAFRSANFQVVGSGQGLVSTVSILAELPVLAARIADGIITVTPVGVPLAEVERTWTAPVGPGERVVLIPHAA